MQVNISEEPLYTEIDKKNDGAQLEHPDEAPAFTPTVRTPQCGHSVLGNPKKSFPEGCCLKRDDLEEAIQKIIANEFSFMDMQNPGYLINVN